MAIDIVELLESELLEAVNNLEIQEDEDDQEKMREMILRLQVDAFNRGLSMGGGSEGGELSITISSDDATALVKELLVGGSLGLRISVGEE